MSVFLPLGEAFPCCKNILLERRGGYKGFKRHISPNDVASSKMTLRRLAFLCYDREDED